jgi:hypothetical protein
MQCFLMALRSRGGPDEGRLIPPLMSTNVSRQTIVMVY